MHRDAVGMVAAWLPPSVAAAVLEGVADPDVRCAVVRAVRWVFATTMETLRMAERHQAVMPLIRDRLECAVLCPETELALAGPLPNLQTLYVCNTWIPVYLAERCPRLRTMLIHDVKNSEINIPPSVTHLEVYQFDPDCNVVWHPNRVTDLRVVSKLAYWPMQTILHACAHIERVESMRGVGMVSTMHALCRRRPGDYVFRDDAGARVGRRVCETGDVVPIPPFPRWNAP